ncbi:MAG TPA: DUF2752 domain-containing protein [Candidatus Solibacter sp.]|jgi:hypothetical protein|nr:DUF2752 domain-containing protein [Candidatus Solibacter sp.]
MVASRVLVAQRIRGPEPAMVAGGLSVLGASYVLPVFWSRGVTPIPPCIFHQITGQPCPMCGATRSFVALAHADFGKAVYLYPLAPLMFLAMLIGIGYGGWVMLTGRRITWRPSRRAQQRIGLVIVALFAANWLAKLLWLGFGPLPFPGA